MKKNLMRYKKLLEQVVSGYDYLFYRIYVWQKDQWKDSVTAINSAGINVGVLIGMNLITLSEFVTAISQSTAVYFFELPIRSVVIITLAWVGVFLGIYTRRAAKIIAEFGIEHESKRSAKTIYVWGYGIGTAFLFFGSIIAAGLSLQGK